MRTESRPGVELLASPVRRALVESLALHATDSAGEGPGPAGLTAAELAERHDLHVTTVRFHLDQLVAAGVLEARFRRSARAGRPSKVYSVAAGSLDHSSSEEGFRILASLLASTLSEAAQGHTVSPEEAGAAWARSHVAPAGEPTATSPGQWIGKVGRMVDVLRDWGYTPEVSTSGDGRTAEIRLAHCPFLDLAKDNPAVVCGVHRGLIAGTMEQLGEPDTAVSLEPFVGPRLCTAHVTTRTPFAPRRKRSTT